MTCINFEFNNILPTESTSLIKTAHNWYGFFYVFIQIKTDDNRKMTVFTVRVSDLVQTSLFHVCKGYMACPQVADRGTASDKEGSCE